MSDEILNKDVNITSVEMKNGKISFKDQDNLKYGFFKLKKDNTKTAMFKQWETMGLDENQIVNIGYKEEQREYEGKPYTARDIISFRETSTTPVKTEKPASVANNTSGGQSEDFWDKKAYKQCLWGYWLQNVAPILAANGRHNWNDLVWGAFKEIEEDADKRFSPVRQAVEKVNPNFFEEAPLPEAPPEVRVEDIPF